MREFPRLLKPGGASQRGALLIPVCLSGTATSAYLRIGFELDSLVDDTPVNPIPRGTDGCSWWLAIQCHMDLKPSRISVLGTIMVMIRERRSMRWLK
ncbi:hypothetical protein BDZ97DRAFT_1865924, partial [Flammula alnicola]